MNLINKNQRPKRIENKKVRVIVVLFAALLGFPIAYIFSCIPVDNETPLGYLLRTTGAVPLLFCLWVFRTYDTRQQIAKTDAQIMQSQFADSRNNLASNDPLKVEIGVASLIEISETTIEFNKQIKLSFIKRLKQKPNNEIEIPGGTTNKHGRPSTHTIKLSYAPYILQWLIEQIKPDERMLNLAGIDCCNQDFNTDIGKNLKLKKLLANASHTENMNFSGVFLENADFKDLTLINTNFFSAKLAHADFSYAKLTKVNFSAAKLSNAKFTNTALKHVNFFRADFRATNFTNATLQQVDLTRVHFLSINQFNKIKNLDDVLLPDGLEEDLRRTYPEKHAAWVINNPEWEYYDSTPGCREIIRCRENHPLYKCKECADTENAAQFCRHQDCPDHKYDDLNYPECPMCGSEISVIYA